MFSLESWNSYHSHFIYLTLFNSYYENKDPVNQEIFKMLQFKSLVNLVNNNYINIWSKSRNRRSHRFISNPIHQIFTGMVVYWISIFIRNHGLKFLCDAVDSHQVHPKKKNLSRRRLVTKRQNVSLFRTGGDLSHWMFRFNNLDFFMLFSFL